MRYINKKKKNNFSYWYYKFLFIFLFVFGMFFLLNNIISSYVYKSNIKDYSNIVFLKPLNTLKIFNLANYKNLLEENKRLEEEVLSLKYDNNKLNEEREDITNLRKLSSVKLYTDYNKVFAKVLYRNRMYWYNTITLDKGYSSRIKNNSLVVGESGLIGVIKSVTKTTSSVELITNNNDDNKISVGVKTKEGFKYGTIEKYEHPYLKVELMVDNKYINLGDMVVTSGLGNLPKGIEIGKVRKQEKDSYNLTNILYVEPEINIDELNYVMVLNK